MSSPMERTTADFQWFVVERWQEFEGESRANLLRALGLAAFYGIELVNYHTHVPGMDRPFHLAVTALAFGWALSGWGVLTLLRSRVFPEALKYVSTALDAMFLTAILLIADGPKSPLVVGYFLLLCLAALRFSLPLMRFSTGAAVAGYLFLLGNARWLRPQYRIPRYHQAIFVLALIVAGVLLGQLLRRVRAAAADYAARLAAA